MRARVIKLHDVRNAETVIEIHDVAGLRVRLRVASLLRVLASDPEARSAAREEQLLEALEWMGGSNDFAPGGKARKGWLRIVAPLLERAGRRL